MKKIMEMLQNMKAKNEKKDNKGFSLVELIIVIAIMAILVGVVGTQVIPYISKSKVAKDQPVSGGERLRFFHDPSCDRAAAGRGRGCVLPGTVIFERDTGKGSLFT